MCSILLNISNSIGNHAFFSVTFHQRTSLSPTGSLSSPNAPWPRCYHLCLVVWTSTTAGTHRGIRRFEWFDTPVPPTSFKCATSQVAISVRLSRTLTINRSSARDMAKGCPPIPVSNAHPLCINRERAD